MRVYNYNDRVRDEIDYISLRAGELAFNTGGDFFDEYEKWFDEFKETKKYKEYLSVCYSTLYILLKGEEKYPLDAEEYDEDEKALTLDKLRNIDNIEEFSDMCDATLFYDLCEDVSDFINFDINKKKLYVESSKEEKNQITKVNPMYILDIMHYLNTYDATTILDKYYENIYLYKDKKKALNEASYYGADSLIELSKVNYYNYKYILLDMLKEYYLFSSYLLESVGYLEDEDINNMNKMECNLDSFMKDLANNKDELINIFSTYIQYLILDDDKIDEINKFYVDKDSESKLRKVIKECNILKK